VEQVACIVLNFVKELLFCCTTEFLKGWEVWYKIINVSDDFNDNENNTYSVIRLKATPSRHPSRLQMDSSDLVLHGSLDPRESVPKRHLDRFSRFYTAHPCVQTQTDRQTHRRTTG